MVSLSSAHDLRESHARFAANVLEFAEAHRFNLRNLLKHSPGHAQRGLVAPVQRTLNRDFGPPMDLSKPGPARAAGATASRQLHAAPSEFRPFASAAPVYRTAREIRPR